jgi:SPP1 family predicted phage head-tail adaptor
MRFDPGRLDQRVTLQQASASRDAEGGPVETWADVATVWADVRPVGARSITRGQQAGAAVSKEVTIRWRSGLSSAMRVLFADGSAAKVSWVEDWPREARSVLVVEDLNG